MRFPAFIRAPTTLATLHIPHYTVCSASPSHYDAIQRRRVRRMRWNTTIGSDTRAETGIWRKSRRAAEGFGSVRAFFLWAEGDGRTDGHTETLKQSNRWKTATENQREESESQTHAAGAMRAKRRGWALKMCAVLQSLLLCTLCLQIRGEFHLRRLICSRIALIWWFLLIESL